MQGMLSRRNGYDRPEKKRACDPDRIYRCQIENGEVMKIVPSKTSKLLAQCHLSSDDRLDAVLFKEVSDSQAI